ncbi:tat pathway signal sequence [Hyaloscypha variabilis]
MVNEDEVSLLEEHDPWSNLKRKSQGNSWSIGITTGIVYSLLRFVLGIGIGPYWPGRLNALCLSRTAMPSPLTSNIKVLYYEQLFNSTLFGTSIYRQEPGPECTVGVILVNADKAIKARITKGHITTPPETGSQYFVNIELGETEFVNEDYIVRMYADPLREQLICIADIGVLPYVRVKNKDRAYPDFLAAPHICRNFEDIREWTREQQLGSEWTGFLHDPQPGDIVLDQIP